jgi:aldose 1-epimerase
MGAGDGRPGLTLETDGCRARIDLEQGGRLASLQLSGWELLPGQGADTIHWGSYVVAPWTGRLRGGRFAHAGRTYEMPLNAPPHALHGLVFDRPWAVLGDRSSPDQVALGVELERPWPWRGRVVHSLRLLPDRLESRLELLADETMPAAMGWHPWFLTSLEGPGGRVLGPLELDVQPSLMYANDADGLPTGELVAPRPRPWDDCFIDMAHPPRLRWPARPDALGGLGWSGAGLQLEIDSDCPCWIVYDREPQAVAVEPWTAPPNSLNLPSPRLVTPDEPLVASMTWRWRTI